MDIATNLKHIAETIRQTKKHYQLPGNDIDLIAVSKYQPVKKIQEALEAGHRIFGENRVQEMLEKWPDLKASYPDIELHLIGPLQTNKVKDALSIADVIETVDRKKLVDSLVKHGCQCPCYIQVNTGQEEQKSGVSIDELESLLTYATAQGLIIVGLMCIPPKNEDPSLHFALLKQLAARYRLDKMSMGMSSDFKEAIAQGATSVRVGTGVFGSRLPVK